MSTVQALINQANAMYPNATPLADKIMFMNMALSELTEHHGVTKEDNTLRTVADQDVYDMPSDVEDISQVIAVAVGKDFSTGSRYSYTPYKHSRRDANPQVGFSYHQIFDSAGTPKIVLYPAPTLDDRHIIIRYRVAIPPLQVGSLQEEPMLDKKYQYLLSLYCAHMICSAGSSPDIIQANAFMQKYEYGFRKMIREFAVKEQKNKNTRRDNPQWHRSKSFGVFEVIEEED